MTAKKKSPAPPSSATSRASSAAPSARKEPAASAPAMPPAAPAAADTQSRTVKVLNRYGIHARPAALLVKAASRYGSLILLEKDGVKVNAKSIMGLLTLEGAYGSTIVIHAQGVDAAEAVATLADLFAQKFFED